MNEPLLNPAFWASVAALVASLGFEVDDATWEHVMGGIGAIFAFVGIVAAWRKRS